MDLYLLRREAQHPHRLVLGIVGSLVRGEDHDAVPVGIGHGTLRLQEGVLRPGRGEFLREDMPGVRNGRRRVAPLDVLVGQEVPLPVDQGRTLRHGLLGTADHGEHLVIHLHQGLGLFQGLLVPGGHDADGVAQVMSDVPHGDHGVPVLFQVAHLVAPGDVGGGKHPRYAGQGLGLLRVNRQDPGPGVLGADGGGVEHPVHIHVVGIDSRSGDFFLHVHPGYPGSQGPAGGNFRNLPLPEELRRQKNRVDNLHISSATADVVPDGKGRFLPGGAPVPIQKGLGAHDHTRDAEAALDRPGLSEGVCINPLFKVRQALHREDAFPLQLIRLRDAGPGGLAVDEYRTGTAGALAASVLHGSQAQAVPQETNQLLVFLHGDWFAVYGKCRHKKLLASVPVPVPRPCCIQKGQPFRCCLLYTKVNP